MNTKAHGRENDSVEVIEETEKSELAKREEAVLEFWQEQNIFKRSVDTPAGSEPVGDFVFYDGPPFATGLPHYGHLLAGTMKDAVPRFWTMNGYRVRRQWGWDCHGLPLENIIEKELGLGTKKDIEDYGIKNFNEKARTAVLRYADDWRRIVPRLGRFVDMENDYKTMDSSYTESVWWVFKQLNEKGLVYEGFKSMHLCPRCGTTLSNFEVNQGYKDIKDIAVTVKLPLLDGSGQPTDTSLLVWTTTPWTLPGNTAAAVHQDLTYVKVRSRVVSPGLQNVKGDEELPITQVKSEYYILAKGRLEQLDDHEYEVVEEMSGQDLVGKKYQPPFPWLQEQDLDNQDKAWTIYHADYVEEGEEGTGAVHIAPAYGEDDMNLAKENGVPIYHHVDESGHFKEFIKDFAGLLVKPKDDEAAEVSHLDADIMIVRSLKDKGVLLKKENITHSYPHCWRCDTPLLNYATTSWFVEVTQMKDRLVKANQTVNWVPEHVGKNRFGKWLEGARDWAVSRQRYWGAPLPIWKNAETEEYKVFGTLEELKEYVPKSGNSYFLMRHGESESNVNGVVQTVVDNPNPLTETGEEEVTESIDKLKDLGITKIISSPYQRTKETTKIIQDSLGLNDGAVIFDDRLGEIKLPSLEGLSNEEYHSILESGEHWSLCAPEGGETWSDVRKRVGECLYEIENEYQGEKVLLIAHNAVLRMIYAAANGSVLTETEFDHDSPGRRFENAEIRQLEFTPLPHNENYELDLHRPYIDNLQLSDNGVKLERIPDVFDCWFESGSMPYAQQHYLGENKDEFTDSHYPAQFIAEGLDQTRGWFYSLMVLGVALFNESPYKNVIVNGLVLAEDGKKMSKSLQNYPDPMELTNKVGADTIRFYLMSSPVIKGEDLNFSEKDVQELQRKNIGRLHNVLQMYLMYADGGEARDDSDNVLDKWIIARLGQLTAEITEGYKKYELDKATRPITDFIDDLSVWYLRRSRDRLKGEDTTDKQQALATLRHVLQKLALVMAPSMPFYAEHLYREVRSNDDADSVHLARWPETETMDPVVIGEMSLVREFVTLALESRTKAGIKVRQPLSKLTIAVDMEEEYKSIIADEINVKKVEYADLPERVQLDTELSKELLAEGAVRELMRAVQSERKKAGLEPSDEIGLIIQADKDSQKAIEANRDLLIKTVGANELSFTETAGEAVEANGHSFIFKIVKK